ncbi:MAG: T9SS type A sorting domain-containing protein [Chitinispirillaceae bacterium]|nr:T9SS type A sorting domain-containing protein [Chitinispirillaceae bacterium]
MLEIAGHLRAMVILVMVTTGIFSQTPEEIYLSGTIRDAVDNTPIDSVRIASSLYTTITYSSSEGTYRLPVSGKINCRPDTEIITLGKEYSFSFSINKGTQRLVSDEPLSVTTAQLFDLQGRIINLALPSSNHSRTFPDQRISPGVYFLRVSGFHPQRILVTNNRFKGTFSRKERVLEEIRPPDCPSDDTIYCYKPGYWPAVLPIADVRVTDFIPLRKKRWIAFDIHNHTLLTDGEKPLDSLLHFAFTRFGLDLCTNSEHGGSYYYDTIGNYIADDPRQNEHAPHDSGSIVFPRWYTLKEYSWPKILGQRTVYPDKILLQGLEWNVPGHEHGSVGFIDDADQPEAVSDFEYQFDFNDFDTSRPELVKHNKRWLHEDALAGLHWLDSLYPRSSYFFINHPSREAIGPYPVNAFRDFNNLAPDVCFGFEGMPGHHKVISRGKYYYGSTNRNRTWGGADYVLAQLGGMWDALLGEGRHFWTIVNSDFHNLYEDHWPGEYTKSWVAIADTGARGWLESMRNGEIFITLGDLICALDFTFDDGIHAAGMGNDFHAYSDTLAVTIRFKSPEENAHGDSPQVDHIDLIAGPVNGKIDPTDENYLNPSLPTTLVQKRFTGEDWITEDGWKTIRTTVVCNRPAYYRLRGTNNVIGSSENLDENGEPTIDASSANTETAAWSDLWFYSNPVFVYPR